MTWLLVVFVFSLDPSSNQPRNGQVYYKPFVSEEECNLVGRNFREVFNIPASRRSMSVCLTEEAFQARDWQVIG